MVAKAILVTTKGGSSTVHIQFPKRTAARLHRLRSLSLMLRLSVRNAAAHLPTATTVLALANALSLRRRGGRRQSVESLLRLARAFSRNTKYQRAASRT